MEALFETWAPIAAALFTGAAFYINVVEHPARMKLPAAAALAQWKPAYQNGTLMQASLAIIGFVLGFGAFIGNFDWRWFLGAVLIVSNWPYTFYLVMPVNKRLLAMDGADEAAIRKALNQWNLLHAGRTALGLLAVLAMAWAAFD